MERPMTTSRTDSISIEDQLGLPNAHTLQLIHDIELERSGGRAGIRDMNLLESAVGSVVTAMSFDPEMDKVDAAAKLAFGIMRNHPFTDGNKRTSLAAAEMTLKGAGYQIVADPDDIADAILEFAANAKGYEEVSRWLRANVKLDMEFALADSPAVLTATAPAEGLRH